MTFVRAIALLASWRLIISSFSEMVLRSSGSCSCMVSPSNAFTDVSNSSANKISKSESGTDKPVSHS